MPINHDFIDGFEKINRVPINKYDKKLDVIVTERYILK